VCLLHTTWGLAGQLPLERLSASPNLSGPQAEQVQVAPGGDRVAYLRAADDDRRRKDLWVFERGDSAPHRLLDSSSLGAEERLSSAEIARRERQRRTDLRGISQFQWSADGHSLLVQAGQTLSLATWQAGQPARLRTLLQGVDFIDPQLSPQGRYLAWVQVQNLQVMDLRTGHRRSLTHDGGGTVHNAEAEAEFVAQEEMDQPHGYWWAPDDSAIAFKRFDERRVPPSSRARIGADSFEVDQQRYPFAGSANVALQLGVVKTTGGPTQWLKLGPDRDLYLPRVAWLPGAQSLSFERQSRDQKRLELVRVDLRSQAQHILRTEQADTWVDLHDDLHFLTSQPAFIWAGVRGGRKHLELVGMDGHTRHALTAGNWQVDRLLGVDEAAGLVYVAGDQGLATQRHVWRVKLDGSTADQPELLSSPNAWHEPVFATGEQAPQLWVDTWSTPSYPPRTAVRDLQGRSLAWLEANPLDAQHPYFPYLDHHQTPEFGQLKADDGTPLSYALTRPPGFDPAKRYPVLLYVYGGPLAQEVTYQWQPLFLQALVQRGFIVMRLDNRGSDRRDEAFSHALHGRLGELEVRDQLAGLHWLAQQPGVDMHRVGVYGHSYGGYLTLMLLAKAPPGTFAAGIAASPVTRFELYDTTYTERYLGTPQANPQGYRDSSVLAVSQQLTSPLLLVHGMADDNVLFTNSTALMSALQGRAMPFRFMAYPGATHQLEGRDTADHFHRLVEGFLRERLTPDPAYTSP
jgi:dipeptidyl-peptidase-4